jgi:uncharacterized protein YjbI with pentapeptide repeats
MEVIQQYIKQRCTNIKKLLLLNTNICEDLINLIIKFINSDRDLSGIDLSGIEMYEDDLPLSDHIYHNSDLSNSSLYSEWMSFTKFDVKFSNLDSLSIRHTGIYSTYFQKSKFEKCIMTSMKFVHLAFQDNIFIECDLRGTLFHVSSMVKCTFINCDFRGCDFKKRINMFDCKFINCDFREVDMKGLYCVDSIVFEECNLEYSYLPFNTTNYEDIILDKLTKLTGAKTHNLKQYKEHPELSYVGIFQN